MHNNTISYPCQYANVFAYSNTDSYSFDMDKMREILRDLMGQYGDDAYSLETKSGVPQPTTQRFLSGKHGDPRSSTVRKWAGAYGLTESQLRGDAPIAGVKFEGIKNPHAIPRLNGAQSRAVSLIGRMDKRTQEEFLVLFEKLVPERRTKNSGHDPLRRLDDNTYLGHDLSASYDTPMKDEKEEQSKRRKNQ